MFDHRLKPVAIDLIDTCHLANIRRGQGFLINVCVAVTWASIRYIDIEINYRQNTQIAFSYQHCRRTIEGESYGMWNLEPERDRPSTRLRSYP